MVHLPFNSERIGEEIHQYAERDLLSGAKAHYFQLKINEVAVREISFSAANACCTHVHDPHGTLNPILTTWIASYAFLRNRYTISTVHIPKFT